MASFLKKHVNVICRSVVRPQENLRLEVLHEYLDQYIRLIKELVPLVPTESLFDMMKAVSVIGKNASQTAF
jgi:hypothetical protein